MVFSPTNFPRYKRQGSNKWERGSEGGRGVASVLLSQAYTFHDRAFLNMEQYYYFFPSQLTNSGVRATATALSRGTSSWKNNFMFTFFLKKIFVYLSDLLSDPVQSNPLLPGRTGRWRSPPLTRPCRQAPRTWTPAGRQRSRPRARAVQDLEKLFSFKLENT